MRAIDSSEIKPGFGSAARAILKTLAEFRRAPVEGETKR